ncbi:MAG: SUMF1/EgtB/PvdO family nonheme iron enzyme [Nitrospiria bacterium]
MRGLCARLIGILSIVGSLLSGPAWAQTMAIDPAFPAGSSPPGHPTCNRCHVDGATPVARPLTDPMCAECHLPAAATPPPALTRVMATVPVKPPIAQTLIAVSGGEFTMGNDGRGDDGPGDEDERPAHRVRVKPFRIDRYETTNAMYHEFVRATGRGAPHHWTGGRYPADKADHPAVYVSWHDADAFCRWAGKRLPTEAEWERAARGTEGRRFPWGHAFSTARANTPQYWLVRHAPGDTMPVGSFPEGRSPEGIDDLAGNVYEWVADWYQPYPGNAFPNIHYGTKNKVLRGGSWYDCLSYGCGLSSPAYNRSRFAPEIKNKGFGFRCAR